MAAAHEHAEVHQQCQPAYTLIQSYKGLLIVKDPKSVETESTENEQPRIAVSHHLYSICEILIDFKIICCGIG